jgi:iron complex outermembrane receptor protein
VGYVDSRINRDVIGLDTVTTATGGVEERVTRKGTRVVGIPRVTANATARYSFSVGSFPAFIGGSVQHVGEYNSDFRTSPGSNRVLGGYTAVDLRGGVDIGNLSLTAFVNNATNTRPLVYQNTLPPETVGSIRPRTVGVVATYSF